VKGISPKSKVQSPKSFGILVVLFSAIVVLGADNFTVLCADRTAVERVYYQHRIGEKPPFEQAMSRELVEKLVRQDLRKEAVLKKVYGVEMTLALVGAEVQRINATTRAPEMLAEIKAAVGNDTNRFARAVAAPIVVDRLLRARFENDDKLHAAQRQRAEGIRNDLLAAKQGGAKADGLLALLKQAGSNQVSETSWQLGARPDQKPGAENPDEVEIRRRFGPGAQIISPPAGVNPADEKFYFADLPADLQNVLRVQLRQAGDISAVIEMPGGFLLYVAEDRTPEILSVVSLSVPKQDFDRWLDEQTENNP
jgi:hypothetical protein